MQVIPVFLVSFFSTFYGIYAGEEYGNAVVDKVISVYDGDTFRVNIKDYPPIIGEDMPIRIAGINTPEIRGTTGYTQEVAQKARKFTQYQLKKAKIIELKNMRRGKYFRIVADVYIDGVNLSRVLIRVGLAKRYDGGPRPTW